MASKRKPRPLACRECGCDMGYGWAEAPLCRDCGQLSLSICVCTQNMAWEPDVCPVHPSHNPYDIPF